MSEQFELIARVRARSGTGLVRRLRREGDVPAVLYGGGKPNVSIAINHDVLFHSLEEESFHSAVIVINTDGQKEQAILKDIQRHPHKTNILHADFQRVDRNKPITINMPIHFEGEDDCIGVKIDGGMINHLISSVEVTCLPEDLPERIEVDVSNLQKNESLHLSDISLPEGVELTSLMYDESGDHDLAIVSVSARRVEIIDESEQAAEEISESDQEDKVESDSDSETMGES
ncbi:MAG: 50S ribosomal protein L25/general stress protein Ctc [Gammaproteobacteria bacterium]|nr:50S ribosomal protein L25/general stress protein Ctc [Gammaproteobacteria bacterium]MCY4218670.1 50S ribosomal protein L25/general stress protein Ctc [Gammaproteobacteria bacterium]MCY4274553.1 50S ribosomal protein L25/general stress protein Ctc [Gammaproteobacteria bacterium]